MDAKLAKMNELVTVGRETDDEVKNEAFRLWIEYGRGWKRVSEATGIAIRTLHHWGTVDKWEQRRIEQAQAFMPGVGAETSFSLRLAAHNASRMLQQLSFDAVEHGVPLDLKQVQALTLIVDRGGFSPVGARAQPFVDLKSQLAATAGTLSDDDLVARESAIGSGRNG